MQWPDAPDGTTRIVRRFLFVPTRLGRTIKWLEWATIKQTMNWGYGSLRAWENTCWEEEAA